MEDRTKVYIKAIQDAVNSDNLVVFVGAGVSASSGVPTWGCLIDDLRTVLPKKETKWESDYLKLAELCKQEFSSDSNYLLKVKALLKDGHVSPNPIHTKLFEFNPCCIVTTNYDDLLEQAAEQNYKQYSVIRTDTDFLKNNSKRLLIKMHGDFVSDKIVLTEKDYLRYSKDYPLIRAQVLSLFAAKTVLFVGFSFSDINLKYILQQVNDALGESVRNVYLLSDKPYTPVYQKYYENSGIKVIYVEKNDLDREIAKQGISCDSGSLSSIGLQVYRTLCVIKDYKRDLDAIELVATFYHKYISEISILNRYLRYVFPNQRGYRRNLSDLYLPDIYRDNFLKSLRKSTVPQLKKKYGADLDDLRTWIRLNHISRINDCCIISDSMYKKNLEKNPESAHLLVTTMDFSKITDQVKDLRARVITCTKEDLELPYLLYHIGEKDEAFEAYSRLAPQMWSKGKYVLHFICVYNMQRLAGYVLNSTMATEEQKRIARVAKNIHLERIIEDVPLDDCVRRVLFDLCQQVYLYKLNTQVGKLRHEINMQKQRSEGGGLTWSYNESELNLQYAEADDFIHENYLIVNTSLYSLTTQDMMYGIWDSLSTQGNGLFVSTNLTEIPTRTFSLFTFDIPHSKLKESIRLNLAEKVEADGMFINIMVLSIANLAKYCKNTPYKERTIDTQTVVNQVQNILSLSNHIKEMKKMPDIYYLISEFWCEGQFGSNEEVISLIRRQPPTKEDAQLLWKAITNFIVLDGLLRIFY